MSASTARAGGDGDKSKAKEASMGAATPQTRTILKYKLHWHVMFTHFPISFFMVSAGFMVAHLFTRTSCFETASYVTLIAGAAVMWPTTLTGWSTWKRRYKGARTKIFLYKIRISFAMTALSTILAIWHGVFPAEAHSFWHYMYFIGFVLLFLGAMAEGYYGGRLNHR